MIQSLTSLRFIFALMIFTHHFSVDGNGLFPEGGALPVSFFFILSGFVLAYSYSERFVTNQINVRSFYIARLTKLYPLHFLCFIVAFVVLFKVLSLKSMWIIPLNLSLIQSWIPVREVYFSYNAVSWFSSNMLFFYLVFPWLIFHFHNLANRRFLILGGCLSVYFALTAVIPIHWQHALFYINPFFRLIDFCLGILLFRIIGIVRRHQLGCLYKKFYATFLELLAICLLVTAVFFAPLIPEVYRLASYYWLPVITIIFVFACFSGWSGYFSKILSIKPLVYLGEISFSFYMIHQLTIGICNTLMVKLGVELSWQSRFIITLMLTICLSIISFRYIEKPVSNWLKLKLLK